MADALPLILWDCGYAETDVQWQGDDTPSLSSSSSSNGSLFREMHSTWTQDVVRSSISSLFLQAASTLNSLPALSPTSSRAPTPTSPLYYPLGGGSVHVESKGRAHYTPLLKRDRGASIDDQNRRWREGARGKRNLEKMAKKREGREASVVAAAVGETASAGHE